MITTLVAAAIGFAALIAWRRAARRSTARFATVLRLNSMLRIEVAHRVECEKALRALGVEPPASKTRGLVRLVIRAMFS